MPDPTPLNVASPAPGPTVVGNDITTDTAVKRSTVIPQVVRKLNPANYFARKKT